MRVSLIISHFVSLNLSDFAFCLRFSFAISEISVSVNMKAAANIFVDTKKCADLRVVISPSSLKSTYTAAPISLSVVVSLAIYLFSPALAHEDNVLIPNPTYCTKLWVACLFDSASKARSFRTYVRSTDAEFSQKDKGSSGEKEKTWQHIKCIIEMEGMRIASRINQWASTTGLFGKKHAKCEKQLRGLDVRRINDDFNG